MSWTLAMTWSRGRATLPHGDAARDGAGRTGARRQGAALVVVQGLTLALVMVAGALTAVSASSQGPQMPAAFEPTGVTVPFMRHPALSPDGQRIAFSYQGDLWTMPVAGGRPLRLTVHAGYDGHPIWSPSGARIAFTTERHGNNDVYVIGADGSAPTRLTYHSTDDVATGFLDEQTVLFATERTFKQVEREDEIYAVSVLGGTPDRWLDALGAEARTSPDGRFIAFRRGSNRVTRPDYRGAANRDLWLYDTHSDTYTQLTTFTGNDFNPAWTGPRELYFLSSRSGAYNIHRLRLNDDGTPVGEAQALTALTGADIRSFSASADGARVVFERAVNVYALDLEGGGEPRMLRVQLPADQRQLPRTYESYSKGADEYALSPNGEEIAFVVRGELFVTEAETDDAETTRATRHPYRDLDVAWLNDTALIFASDRAGNQYDLYRLESADPEAKTLFDSLEFKVVRLTDTPEDEQAPVIAPDGAKIAFRRGNGGLLVADLVAGSIENPRALLTGWAEPQDVAWSPDSRWLAYSRNDLYFNEEVFILAADGSAGPVNVSQHPRGDGQPVWSPDGSKLGFVSERSSGDDDIWFAWLRAEDWERTTREWKQLDDEPDAAATKTDEEAAAEEAPAVEPIEIDLEGIYQRLVRVTALPGNEGIPAISRDGETFYFVTGLRSRTGDYAVDSDLYKIKWDGRKRERVTEGDVKPRAVRLAGDGGHVYFLRAEGTLARVSTEKGALESLPFSATMTIDHDAERRQIFDEAWRSLARMFYDPDFHGVDWAALRDQYASWSEHASTREDFADLINWMLGQVNASHMGYYTRGRGGADTSEVTTGLLGVEVDPVADGVVVRRVVPRSPAARRASTLHVGDVIVAVNGQSVIQAGNLYRLLNGTAGQKTLLEVRSPVGETRRVRIYPTDDLDDALYREWAEERAKLVEDYSEGRVGYIHIEGMNWSSFERFERELVARASGKEGLLVDVRYNGGGWTTDYLMTVLDVRRHAYTIPRGATEDLQANHPEFRAFYPFGERRPFATWTRPVAALANQNSYSNAEIFSHAFKQLGLGPLVGTPTFGAVISTGAKRLIDGSYVRLPFRGWYVYDSGENMEDTPAVPDIMVTNPPNAKALGQDPQLERAVEALLERIDGATAGAAGA